MKLEEEVKNKVEELLWQLLDSCESLAPPDPETFRLVSRRLTRMAILGAAPPSSVPARPSQDRSGNTEAVSLQSDDFSASKENFIAP